MIALVLPLADALIRRGRATAFATGGVPVIHDLPAGDDDVWESAEEALRAELGREPTDAEVAALVDAGELPPDAPSDSAAPGPHRPKPPPPGPPDPPRPPDHRPVA